MGLSGQENRTESSAASAGKSKTVEVQLHGNNGDLCSTVPGPFLCARLGSLTSYPENRTSKEDFLIVKEGEVLGVVSGVAKKETVGAKK